MVRRQGQALIILVFHQRNRSDRFPECPRQARNPPPPNRNLALKDSFAAFFSRIHNLAARRRLARRLEQQQQPRYPDSTPRGLA